MSTKNAVSYKIHNFSNQLGQCEFTKDGFSPNPLSPIQGFERDLDLFQTKLKSKHEETAVLAAKIHLYSYLLRPLLQDHPSTESLNLVQILTLSSEEDHMIHRHTRPSVHGKVFLILD